MSRGELNCGSGNQDSSADLPLTFSKTLMWWCQWPPSNNYLPFSYLPQITILPRFGGNLVLHEWHGRMRVVWLCEYYSKLITVILLSLVRGCFSKNMWLSSGQWGENGHLQREFWESFLTKDKGKDALSLPSSYSNSEDVFESSVVMQQSSFQS